MMGSCATEAISVCFFFYKTLLGQTAQRLNMRGTRVVEAMQEDGGASGEMVVTYSSSHTT